MKYLNKDLVAHTLPELELIWLDLRQAEIKREEASKHPKFDKNSDKKYVGSFPPPNPVFIELKLAIEKEIERKKNDNKSGKIAT